MPKRKTTEEYIQECKERGLDLPVEEYKGAKIKIKHKCSKGHIYKQRPDSHLRREKCSKCNSIKMNMLRRKTSEKYYQECKEKSLDLPIEDYINSSTKIKHKCKDGHIYYQRPNDHLRGKGCPICKGNKKKTSEEYYQECKAKGLDLPIEDYRGALVKIKHKCKQKHIYEQKPSEHLHSSGCPKCGRRKMVISRTGKNKKKTTEEYLQECKSKGLDLPIEDYINANTKIKHKCSKGHIYEQTPSDHLQKYGCPICNESHGERFIRNYLNKNNIKYITQKRFHDLKDKTYLSYDFYLPSYNTLIEYQGKQHYESIDYFGGEKQFNKQRLHDELKREYAKDNGYKLLELKYTLDTQDLIDKYLKRRIK